MPGRGGAQRKPSFGFHLESILYEHIRSIQKRVWTYTLIESDSIFRTGRDAPLAVPASPFFFFLVRCGFIFPTRPCCLLHFDFDVDFLILILILIFYF